MSDLNQVTLIGRLVRDAELKYTPKGRAVSKFSLAVNKKIRSGDQMKDCVQFFDLTVWGKLAESLKPYLQKGKQIAVIGELTQERWQEHGENRSKITITIQNIQLLSGGNSSSSRNVTTEDTFTSVDDDSFYEVPF